MKLQIIKRNGQYILLCSKADKASRRAEWHHSVLGLAQWKLIRTETPEKYWNACEDLGYDLVSYWDMEEQNCRGNLGVPYESTPYE